MEDFTLNVETQFSMEDKSKCMFTYMSKACQAYSYYPWD